MSSQFLRKVQLVIEDKARRLELNEELAVSFEIRKTRASALNEVTIDITNLSPSSRKAIKAAGATATLLAGYSEVKGVLATGSIIRGVTSWDGPDTTTKLYVSDGHKALQNGHMSLSFPPLTSFASIVNKVAARLGLPVIIGNSIKQETTFTNGFSYVGKAFPALTQIATQVKARWSIQNGVLVFAGPSDKRQPLVLLSPETGLLARPEKIESTVINERVVPGRIPANGYVINCLLQPSLNPHDWIRVESKEIKGNFVIDEVSHSGGNRESQMQTRLTVYDR